jgi:hypothetical protein
MHHAGIEFDVAVLVGQPAVTHRSIIGIVFNHIHRGEGGVERVATLAQDFHPAVERMQPVRAGNDDGPGSLRRCSRLQPVQQRARRR